VRLERRDARDLDLPGLARLTGAEAPTILSNPPYGRRARAVGGDPARLLAEVLHGAAGWRFALAYPDPGHVEAVPGVRVEEVRPVRMRGLRTHLVRGRVTARG
jgi:tRNA G10  N-methylase Trm11